MFNWYFYDLICANKKNRNLSKDKINSSKNPAVLVPGYDGVVCFNRSGAVGGKMAKMNENIK